MLIEYVWLATVRLIHIVEMGTPFEVIMKASKVLTISLESCYGVVKREIFKQSKNHKRWKLVVIIL